MVLTTPWPISEDLMKNGTTVEWTVLLGCFDSFPPPFYKNHLISWFIYLMPQLRRDEVEATFPIPPLFSYPFPKRTQAIPLVCYRWIQETPAHARVNFKLQIWSSKGEKKHSLISNIKSQFLSTTASTKGQVLHSCCPDHLLRSCTETQRLATRFYPLGKRGLDMGCSAVVVWGSRRKRLLPLSPALRLSLKGLKDDKTATQSSTGTTGCLWAKPQEFCRTVTSEATAGPASSYKSFAALIMMNSVRDVVQRPHSQKEIKEHVQIYAARKTQAPASLELRAGWCLNSCPVT